MEKKKPSISVFFPFLNDWGTVGSLVALSVATVSKLTDDWEVIVVNDGSKQDDRQALQAVVDLVNIEYKESNIKNKRIKIIDHEKNRGYGGALRSGFETASKDLIFYTDCDAQYDPRELEKLYRALKSDTAMVNGYKIKRNDPLYRTVIGRLYHYAVKLAFGLPIRDTDCDFRLIRKSVFEKVKLHENTGTICVELVKKVSHFFPGKIEEVPVHHFWRTSGKSQFFNFERLFKTFNNLYRLWWKLMVKTDYLT
jgi:glycosyltransferase involved in cell wall biosynthesis